MNNDTQEFHHKLPECAVLIYQKDANARKKLLILVYASLIPLIISVNLLSIFGIIKTKRNKLTSSHIVFLTLFASDLTIGIVQLPIHIYLTWKASDRTCFEIELGGFFMTFLLCLSGTILCVISIDRYITVAHNKYYKRFVTRKLLMAIIIFVTLISFLWAILDAIFKGTVDILKLAKLYIALSAYAGAIIVIIIISNLALLKNVKLKRQNSFIQQAYHSSLPKTIAIILAIVVFTYLPIIIFLNIAAYSFINYKETQFIRKIGNELIQNLIGNDLPWVLISCQLNAILNSVVYLVRNNRMRRYYYKLVHCRSEVKNAEPIVFSVMIDFINTVTAIKSRNSLS